MTDFSVQATGPYRSLICQFVQKQFPRPRTAEAANIVDLIEAEILGTKQVRYGPRPKPESIVMMREVIRERVAEYKPIPIVVPWGSEKPDGSSVDIAELIGLRTLADLHTRVAAHYSPGTHINVRVEDVSAPHLFFLRADEARQEAARYTADMRKLVHVLDLPVYIAAESDKVTEEQFNAKADERLGDFIDGVTNPLGGHTDKWGWKMQRQIVGHYLNSYKTLYPNMDESGHRYMLARYFAAASARYALGLRGDDSSWMGKFLEVTFTQPLPGTESTFARRVHYRTFPLAYTSANIAPWRAKGFLEIGHDDDVTPKLASYQLLPDGLEKDTLTLTSSDLVSVQVQSDYVLA